LIFLESGFVKSRAPLFKLKTDLKPLKYFQPELFEALLTGLDKSAIFGFLFDFISLNPIKYQKFRVLSSLKFSAK
jgi:hypothetical protein